MALELQKYVEDILQRGAPKSNDRPFLLGVLAITKAYLEREGLEAARTLPDKETLDLSKIPYDVDAKDPDLMVGFIRQLKASNRAKNALSQYVDPWTHDMEDVAIRTIRDLYITAHYGDLRIVPGLGKKSRTEIIDALVEARTNGGIFPLTKTQVPRR